MAILQMVISIMLSFQLFDYYRSRHNIMHNICISNVFFTNLNWRSLFGPNGDILIIGSGDKHHRQRFPRCQEVVFDFSIVSSYSRDEAKEEWKLKPDSKQVRLGCYGADLWVCCWGWPPEGCSSSRKWRAGEGSGEDQPEENWGKRWSISPSAKTRVWWYRDRESMWNKYLGGVKGAGWRKSEATSRSAASSIMSPLKSCAASQRLARRHTALKHGCCCCRLTHKQGTL